MNVEFLFLRPSGRRAARIGPKPHAAYRDHKNRVRCRVCKSRLHPQEYRRTIYVNYRQGNGTRTIYVNAWVHEDAEEKACLMMLDLTQGARP